MHHYNSDITELVSIVREAISPDKIILFGSYAYGTPNSKSDVDLLVIKNNCEFTIKEEADLATLIFMKRREKGIRTRCDAFLETEESAKKHAENGGSYSEALNRGVEVYVR